MKKMRNKLNLLLCTMLVASMMLVTNGCGSQTKTDDTADAGVQVSTEAAALEDADAKADAAEATATDAKADAMEAATTDADTQTDVTVLGEGEKTFAFTVVDADGNETAFEIHTDGETVGEALLSLGVIAGDDGDYGLYVKEVNGITADYDVDGTYWAFYVNGEYASTGVDQTAVADGDSYSFKVEK